MGMHAFFVTRIAEAVQAAPLLQAGLPRIDEPDVSLTDYVLALETGAFAILLARQSARWERLRWWSVAFFGAATLASFFGGTDHGFLRRDGREAMHDVFWTGSLLAIGASALALAGMGVELGLGQVAARRVRALATVLMVAYAAVVLFAWQDFLVAILAYAPAALFLLGAFVRRRLRGQQQGTASGIAAVVLAFVAAAVQQLEIGVHPDVFNHNALYHLIQAVSFALLFHSVRELVARRDEVLP